MSKSNWNTPPVNWLTIINHQQKQWKCGLKSLKWNKLKFVLAIPEALHLMDTYWKRIWSPTMNPNYYET